MKSVKEMVHYWCPDTSSNKYMGENTGVAVMDTGIVPHPDFQGRIRDFIDCVDGRKGAYDDSGHGTHVGGR